MSQCNLFYIKFQLAQINTTKHENIQIFSRQIKLTDKSQIDKACV